MHPRATYCQLRGMILRAFREPARAGTQTIYRLSYTRELGARALYAPAANGQHAGDADAEWRIRGLSGASQYRDAEWDEVPDWMWDRLTQEQIDAL